MEIRGVFIEDTFAEAFGMRAARVVITARTMKWARAAALKLTGFATSVIACKCEAAIERELTPDETPDARPGVSALMFTMDTDSLGKRLTERIGQTVLTCPTASCFDGLPDAPDRLPAARALRTFGDRFQISKVVNGERYWRVPVMEGECLLQESFGMPGIKFTTARALQHFELSFGKGFAHLGNGTNIVYADPENDLVIVARWIENGKIDEFLGKIYAALNK